MKSETLLVTGGRGFIGSSVVQHLLMCNRKVHAFGPMSPVQLPDGATETIGSIEDSQLVDKVISQYRPRQVLHFASFSTGSVGLTRSGEMDPERMLSVNVVGFQNLLNTCVAYGVERVVWTSSTVVLGRANSVVERCDERAPRVPLTNYGMSKLLAEDLADFYRRRHGLEVVGLRIPLVLGPGLWYQGAAAPLNQLAMQAMKLEGGTCNVPSGMFDALHVKDIGSLIEKLINHTAQLAPIYNVAGFTTSYSEIRRCFIDLVSDFQPQLKEFTPEITYPLVSQAMLENDTGWRHRLTLKDTLQDMLIELKKNCHEH